MTPPLPADLLKLIMPPRLPSNISLGPEDGEAYSFTNYLRAAVLEGRFRGVFFHVPNEGKRHRMDGARLKAIGIMPGTPDFVLLWVSRLGEMDAGLLELKRPKGGSVSPAQKSFERWCQATGIRHAICRGAQDAIAVVEGWGAVRAPRVEAA